MKLTRTHSRIAALALTAVLVSPTPAWALDSKDMAGSTPEAGTVVSLRMEDGEPDDGSCTGTAIAPHWVVTARHCMEMFSKPGGTVRTGEGDQQRMYKVDRWEKAPRGDIGLVHTEEPMQLEHFAEVSHDELKNGEVTVYGWSSEGTGGSKTLPVAKGDADTAAGDEAPALFDAPSAAVVSLKNGARIQGGDSGGPIFADGKVAAVMSAGLFDDPDNPSEEDLMSNPKVAVSPVADQAEWIEKTVAGEETASGEAAAAGEEAASGEEAGSEAVSGADTMTTADDGARPMPGSLWIILGSVVIIAGAVLWRLSRR